MNSSKQQFLKDKELAKWWASIVGDERFDKVCTYLRASVMEEAPSKELISGVVQTLHILSTITQGEESFRDFPNPGLHHQAETSKPKPIVE